MSNEELRQLIPPIGSRSRFIKKLKQTQADGHIQIVACVPAPEDFEFNSADSIMFNPSPSCSSSMSIQTSQSPFISSNDLTSSNSPTLSSFSPDPPLAASTPVPSHSNPLNENNENTNNCSGQKKSRYSNSDVDIHHLFVKTVKLRAVLERNSKSLQEANSAFFFEDKELIANIIVDDLLNDWKEACNESAKKLMPPTENKVNAAKAIVKLFPIYVDMFNPTPIDAWFSPKGGSTGILQNRLNVVRRRFKVDSSEKENQTTNTHSKKRKRPGSTVIVPPIKRARQNEDIPNDVSFSFTFFITVF